MPEAAAWRETANECRACLKKRQTGYQIAKDYGVGPPETAVPLKNPEGTIEPRRQSPSPALREKVASVSEPDEGEARKRHWA